MYLDKINTKDKKINNDKYDYYIAVDWSQRNMAIATLRKDIDRPKITDVDSDIEDLKAYLSSLKGRKIVTIEETTSTHWLYVELYNYAEKILICDPYRNKLLSDGAKTDKLDAGKLSLLLRGGLLKEVYHGLEKTYELRQLVCDYEQLVEFGTRILNEKSSIYRGSGKSYKKLEEIGDKTLEWILYKVYYLITHKFNNPLQISFSFVKDEKSFQNLIFLSFRVSTYILCVIFFLIYHQILSIAFKSGEYGGKYISSITLLFLIKNCFNNFAW
jgi:hypothetical protein